MTEYWVIYTNGATYFKECIHASYFSAYVLDMIALEEIVCIRKVIWTEVAVGAVEGM